MPAQSVKGFQQILKSANSTAEKKDIFYRNACWLYLCLYLIRKIACNLCVSASVAPQSFPAFLFTAGPTWCAAAGATADGTSSRSRSSGRVWSPGECAGAGPGKRRWQTSLSSGDTCVVWPPCGTWSESASLTWLRRWAGTLCILVTEKRDTKQHDCGVIRLLQSS